MWENLRNHIERFVEISSHDWTEVSKYFTAIEISKKQNLLVEGNICKSNYFVSKGCLRGVRNGREGFCL
jgi:hypothetical protein